MAFNKPTTKDIKSHSFNNIDIEKGSNWYQIFGERQLNEVVWIPAAINSSSLLTTEKADEKEDKFFAHEDNFPAEAYVIERLSNLTCIWATENRTIW